MNPVMVYVSLGFVIGSFPYLHLNEGRAMLIDNTRYGEIEC